MQRVKTDGAMDSPDAFSQCTGEEAAVETNGKVQRADTITTKRQDYISWDDYFMAVAFLSSMRSKGIGTISMVK